MHLRRLAARLEAGMRALCGAAQAAQDGALATAVGTHQATADPASTSRSRPSTITLPSYAFASPQTASNEVAVPWSMRRFSLLQISNRRGGQRAPLSLPITVPAPVTLPVPMPGSE